MDRERTPSGALNLGHSGHVFVYSMLILGICVILYLFSSEYTRSIDLTSQQLYSLSPATRNYLKTLEEDVGITIFTRSMDPYIELMGLYNRETDRLTWDFPDAVRHPVKAHEAGERVQNGEMFITAGKNSKRMAVGELAQDYENMLTNAIVEVTRKDKLKVYFLTGHGEIPYIRQPSRSPSKQVVSSLQAFRKLLNERGIETAPFELARTGYIPEDASLVVIAGPQTDFLPAETMALREYLVEGGKLLLLLGSTLGHTTQTYDQLGRLLAEFGVRITQSLIIDLFSKNQGLSPIQPLVMGFSPDHPATQDLANLNTQRFPLENPSRALEIDEERHPQWIVTTLATSSPRSWAEDISYILESSREKIQLRPPSDLESQPLAVAVHKVPPPNLPGQPPLPDRGARIVVFGNSDFIQDSFLAVRQTALELMLNSINWLTEREDMIHIPPKQTEGTPIIITPTVSRVVFIIVVVLLPASLFLGGVSYSMMRRRR
jgi:ABC-type uncharacterized transport system involved in gliding motility auxiliary subunit